MTPSDFGRLFINRRDSFVKIARSYVRDQAIAEDIVSECFTTFWDKHESIDLKTSPEAYIMRSVKNRCLNHLRDNAKMMHTEGSIDPEINLRIKSMLSEISVLESSDMGEIFSSEVEGISGNSWPTCRSCPAAYSYPAVSRISHMKKSQRNTVFRHAKSNAKSRKLWKFSGSP